MTKCKTTRKAKKKNTEKKMLRPRNWDCNVRTFTAKSDLEQGRHMKKPFLALYFRPTTKNPGIGILPATRTEALRLKKAINQLVKSFPKGK